MRIATQEQRTVDTLRRPVFDDGLRRGEDVGLVERRVEARSAMPGSPEQHLLQGIFGIGHTAVVRSDQMRNVHQILRQCHLTRPVVRHETSSTSTMPYSTIGPILHPRGTVRDQYVHRKPSQAAPNPAPTLATT